MFVVKKSDFSRDFNSGNIIKKKQKEVQTWQWLILLGCFLFQMLPYCVALNLTNVFVGSDWKIWTGGDQTITGLTFTAGALGAAVAGPFIAKMFSKKINMRVVYSIGVFLAMVGFFGSAINSIIMHVNDGVVPNKVAVAAILWISNIVSQIGVMIFSGLGVNNLISKWWPPERRGFALGIAFAGGSLGNIWMQQLVGALSKEFGNFINTGNKPGTQEYYDYLGNQYATYLIMAGIGLVAGILIVLFVCRKPVPPTQLFETTNNTKAQEIRCVGCDQLVNVNNVKKQALEASPLVTRKYPPYWILAIGFMILQMGTVHASSNGLFVSNGVVINNSSFGSYNTIMATGGTIFGICCLIGNTCGGIINDKLGPWKSISLAGTVQCLAIVSLMLSPGTPALIYLYFALAGLSVYVYTSTPAFISGRLYGARQSNNHMAILGIFVAVGFAIVNSISGSLTGNVGQGAEISYMFGNKTYGNLQNLGIYALVCMGLGTIIVATCCFIIQAKGIKGLLNYSPTKYTKIITFKHALANRLAAQKILLTKKDFRINNEKREEKIENKLKKLKTYNSYEIYLEIINKAIQRTKLTSKEKLILAVIFENNKITYNNLLKQFKNQKALDKSLSTLLKAKKIAETDLVNVGKYYVLSPSLLKSLKQPKLNNAIVKDDQLLMKKIAKLEANTNKKISKINSKLEALKAKPIDEDKQAKITAKSSHKLAKDNVKKEKIFKKSDKLNDWKAYKLQYAILEKIYDDNELKEKLITKKQNELAALNKKIFVANYIKNYNEFKEINGHNLLVDYYNNPYAHCDQLITDNVENTIENRIAKIHKTTNILQNKYNKQLALKQKLVNN